MAPQDVIFFMMSFMWLLTHGEVGVDRVAEQLAGSRACR
jgi:hypothetical protein